MPISEREMWLMDLGGGGDVILMPGGISKRVRGEADLLSRLCAVGSDGSSV